MNAKERELHRIVDIVVGCCSVSFGGRVSLSRAEVLGKGRGEVLTMTRCILASLIIAAGFSVSTLAGLTGRTATSARYLVSLDRQFHKTSRAYRIASAEAAEAVCRRTSTYRLRVRQWHRVRAHRPHSRRGSMAVRRLLRSPTPFGA